jgi:NTE family protein
MSKPRANKRLTALVLQGGGALGAYEYGVIKALYEQPGFKPSVVTGVSIGAFSAAILAGAKGDPVETLGEMWRRFTLPDSLMVPDQIESYFSLFGNSGMYSFNPRYLVAPFLATSVYDTTPLRNALEEWIDVDTLNAAEMRAIVTAVDVQTGELHAFDNRNSLTIDHVLASGSLPPGFPMTKVDDAYYWDGALVSNTPLSAALNAIEQIGENDAETDIEVVAVELLGQKRAVPTNMTEVVGRIFEILFFSKLRFDLKLFEQLNQHLDLLHQLDALVPEDSALREHPAYKRLRRHRRVDRFVLISNCHEETAAGAADFSKASIERRIGQGYEDAKDALQRHD